jgi:hypothetical protein
VDHLVRTNAERGVASRHDVDRCAHLVSANLNLLWVKHARLNDIAKAVGQEQDEGVAVKQEA